MHARAATSFRSAGGRDHHVDAVAHPAREGGELLFTSGEEIAARRCAVVEGVHCHRIKYTYLYNRYLHYTAWRYSHQHHPASSSMPRRYRTLNWRCYIGDGSAEVGRTGLTARVANGSCSERRRSHVIRRPRAAGRRTPPHGRSPRSGPRCRRRTPDDPDLLPAGLSRRRGVAVAFVGIGGFFGTFARFGVEQAWPSVAGHLPWATFVINVSGAFLLGLLIEVLIALPKEPMLRPLLGTGLLGAGRPTRPSQSRLSSWVRAATSPLRSNTSSCRLRRVDRRGVRRRLRTVASHSASPPEELAESGAD